LTRSIGAAAVFETAAATPPTVKRAISFGFTIFRVCHLDPRALNRYRGEERVEKRHTQEVNHETRHPKERKVH
jgi:hypothetical protein